MADDTGPHYHYTYGLKVLSKNMDSQRVAVSCVAPDMFLRRLRRLARNQQVTSIILVISARPFPEESGVDLGEFRQTMARELPNLKHILLCPTSNVKDDHLAGILDCIPPNSVSRLWIDYMCEGTAERGIHHPLAFSKISQKFHSVQCFKLVFSHQGSGFLSTPQVPMPAQAWAAQHGTTSSRMTVPTLKSLEEVLEKMPMLRRMCIKNLTLPAPATCLQPIIQLIRTNPKLKKVVIVVFEQQQNNDTTTAVQPYTFHDETRLALQFGPVIQRTIKKFPQLNTIPTPETLEEWLSALELVNHRVDCIQFFLTKLVPAVLVPNPSGSGRKILKDDGNNSPTLLPCKKRNHTNRVVWHRSVENNQNDNNQVEEEEHGHVHKRRKLSNNVTAVSGIALGLALGALGNFLAN